MSTPAPTVIEETEVTGLPGRTTRDQLEQDRPVTRFKKEPYFILDGSGSEDELADPEGTITKTELICGVVTQLTPVVEGDDAEAAAEQASGSPGKGGMRTFVGNVPDPIEFEEGEDESDDPRDLGDINSANLQAKLDQFRALVALHARTYLRPALDAAKHAFDTEFPGAKDRAMEVIFINDGKLDDEAEVEAWVAANAGPRCIICVVVVGYDPKPSPRGHDAAVAAWNRIAAGNKYLAVDAVTGVADAQEVAFDVQFLAGLAG
jgi:hypothetical protein